MSDYMNELGQPIGAPVAEWSPRPVPAHTVVQGRFCRLEPLDPDRHAGELFAANSADREGRMWTYLPWGPFTEFETYLANSRAAAANRERLTFAIVDAASGKALGVASYLNIKPASGSIEVGALAYAPALQRRPASTEAMFLMMRRVFDECGYRRYEWKTNSHNAASRAAALRLGFQYEGIFRQAEVVKGRNRDTAWFAMTDGDWPAVKEAFVRWLDPGNFDAGGGQRTSLSALRA
ncbi:MAG TPA: GNAT family protein [Stellaceae bacterium]|jgi:RimJ/RimL family protein N-acetyltransferase